MILIADSGSTKTDWIVVNNGEIIRSISTRGINPFFQTEEEIALEIKSTLLPKIDTLAIRAVYFYGAGCTLEKSVIVKRAVEKSILGKYHLEVNSDMLAAARSLCSDKPGIACIIGTGSNSCFYNGQEIVENVSPLGFILGDEGSGAVLGKLFLSDLLKNQLGFELKERFLKNYNLTIPEIIDRIYRQPFPNRFLAQFTPFILEHIHIWEIRNIVENEFKSFLKKNVLQYKEHGEYPVHFVGSVAFHFEEIMQSALHKLGLQSGKFVQSPLEGLIHFHKI